MAERVTVKRAAEILGMNPYSVQCGIRLGELPIGHAILKPGKQRHNYHISPYLLSQYTGLSIEEIKGGDRYDEKI